MNIFFLPPYPPPCQKIKMYQKEVSDLEASIQLLQEENISLVTKLIDGKLENLTVPR